MKILYIYIVVVLLLAFVAGPGRLSQDVLAGERQDYQRRVLGVYSGKVETWEWSNLHQFVEMPVNRLGLVMDSYAVEDNALPDYRKYRAILVWFDAKDFPAYRKYLNWLAEAARAGVRIVAFDGLGVEGVASQEELEPVLKELGIEFGGGEEVINPFTVKYDVINKDAFGYEVSTPSDRYAYQDLKLKKDETGLKPWLLVRRTDVKDSDALAIAAGSKGGFIAKAEFTHRQFSSPIYQIKWFLNPFMFLDEALGTRGEPRPDVTTYFGSRGGYSHIDGDGMVNMVQDIPGKDKSACAVLYNRILTKFPVPVGVSYVAVRLTSDGGITPEFLELFKKVMARSNVIPAAHGYTHTMVWAQNKIGIPVKGYKYDREKELTGALEMVTKLTCPPDKSAEIFYWTGDCVPMEADLKVLYDAGKLNINGGDPRYDQLYDSVSNICSLSRQVGKYRQIYSSGSNEFLYTDGWTENFGGFANVIKTFERSASPRYLPVDIYYHVYLCERQAGVRSLMSVYEWALKQGLCWLSPNEYVRAVMSFDKIRTAKKADGGYEIRNYSDLQTIRFDEAGHVDMAKSKNVLGYTEFAGSTYVSLLPGEVAEIYLSESEGGKLYMKRSTSKLKDINMGQDKFSASVRIYGAGFISFGPAGVKIVGAEVNGKKAEIEGDKVKLPQGMGEWVNLEVNFAGVK